MVYCSRIGERFKGVSTHLRKSLDRKTRNIYLRFMENTTSLSPLATLNEEVAQAIKGSGVTIKNTVVAKFVQDEINRRADLLARLIVAINTFRKEGFKIKADVVSYNAAGEVASENWSKAQLDKKKKFDEKLAKAENVFAKALNDNEYDKVEEVINQLKAVEGKDAKKSEDGAACATC
jgi:hypothetical protein